MLCFINQTSNCSGNHYSKFGNNIKTLNTKLTIRGIRFERTDYGGLILDILIWNFYPFQNISFLALEMTKKRHF